MTQGHWQSAANHLMKRFKQLQQQQQQDMAANAASTGIIIDSKIQQEQLHQAEHMWNGLQVCRLVRECMRLKQVCMNVHCVN